MKPPLRERVSWRTPMGTGVDVPASRATMARAGAALGLGGAAVAAIAIVAPHEAEMNEPLLGALALLTLMGCAALVLGFDRLPRWSFHIFAVVATGIAAAAVYGWGTDSMYAPLPYLWVVVYVCWFFRPAAALAYLALIALSYAGVLALEDARASAVGGWLATVATLAVTSLLIIRARERMASLVANLTDAARRDPLTALLNRRGFEEEFDLELERGRRTDSPLTLVVADVDRFKEVNDTLGHGAGDHALRRVGELISSAKRRYDSAARVGGEEFALLAPDADEHGAYLLAERIRTAVERETEMTVSLGVASSPLHGHTAEALLQAADQALYAAKRLGRNRSVISSAEVPGILARPTEPEREHVTVEVEALVGLAESLDVRDAGTASHCHRVGRFAELIARELGLPPDSVDRLRVAGLLHDVGRVGVPEGLTDKPGPLSDLEWRWVRAHPVTGARMLESTGFADICDWIRFHHERPDGTGYPAGLRGDEVPLEAKVLAVAEAYEAMTSDRPYRPALGPEEAAEELRRGAGSQFDEQVVEALLRLP